MRLGSAFLVCVLAGCAQMRVDLNEVNSKPGATPPPAPIVTEARMDSLFWGLVKLNRTPSERAACGEAELQRLEMKMSWSDVVLTGITAGIYVPHRAKFSCAGRNP